MATGFYDSLHGLAGTGLSRAASTLLDEHEFGAGKTIENAFAAILCGLERNSTDLSLMGEVARLIGEEANDSSVLADPMSLLEPTGRQRSLALGDELVATLFGARTHTIATAIARASGVGTRSALQLLPVAGAMVLATLRRRFAPGALSPSALAAAITTERAALTRIVPPYLSRLILGARDGGTKLPAAASQVPGLSSMLWLLIPICLLLGAFWYLFSPSVTETETRRSATSGTTSSRESDRDTRTAARDSDKTESSSTWKSDSPSSSGSSTWTAPSSSTSTSAKAPPLAGLIRLTLSNGTEIDVQPYGVEQKVIDFLGDRWAFIDKAKWFDFDRVRFLSGSAELTPGSRAQLRNISKILKANPTSAVKIGGYTDNLGDAASNLRLSDQRAKRVMQELIKLGVEAERLTAEGYGDLHPIADNATAEGRAKNRRTAISVRAK